jgi:hypothetical protein
MYGVCRKVVLAKPRLNELIALEKLRKELRVPTGNAIGFTILSKFSGSKGPRCLKKPTICKSA